MILTPGGSIFSAWQTFEAEELSQLTVPYIPRKMNKESLK